MSCNHSSGADVEWLDRARQAEQAPAMSTKASKAVDPSTSPRLQTVHEVAAGLHDELLTLLQLLKTGAI